MTHYLIYKITNKLNGKIYIGQHQTDNLDDGYMGSGVAINRAIKKYGIENFSKEILFDVDDWELMDFLEELIVDEAFVARKDTYNIALGGSSGAHPVSEETKRKISTARKGMLFSEKHKKNLSESHKGKHVSEEIKRKMSEALKGHPGYTKGKHHSEETKKKISESHKGKGHPHSDESRKKISEANKGKHLSEETKRKLSEFHKGKKRNPCSEEARRKMSEAKKKYWSKKRSEVA